MSVISLLASSLNQRVQDANQELAEKIIKSNKTDWIKELVDNLDNPDKRIQGDCIKVLYEIGERGHANLISQYCNEFGKLLASKNNRMVWGAMTALDMIADVNQPGVYKFMPLIIEAIDGGSVITIDHGVSIFAKLASRPKYSKEVFPLLLNQLKECPAKQLPMYAEKSVIAVSASNKKQFIGLLKERLTELGSDSQRKRIEKVINKFSAT